MIIDLHKAAGFSFDPDEGETGFFESEALQGRFYALWERIAKRFGGVDNLWWVEKGIPLLKRRLTALR